MLEAYLCRSIVGSYVRMGKSSKKENGDFVSCLRKKGKKEEGNGHEKNKLL